MRPLGNSEAQSYKVLHLSWKIIWANLTVWCSKMQPLSGISALTSEHVWWRCLLYWHLPRGMQICSNIPRLPPFSKVSRNPPVSLTFLKAQNPSESIKIHCACHKHDGWMSKGSERTLRTFSILIWKRASCHIQKCSEHEESWKSWSVFDNVLRATTACTFNISTSKNRPNPGCS